MEEYCWAITQAAGRVCWSRSSFQCVAARISTGLSFIKIRGMSGKYPAVLNISRNGRVALMQLGSQSEETLLCISEQSLYSGASQSTVRRRWLSLYTVWPSNSQWPSEQISFIMTIACPFYSTRVGFLGKASHQPGLSTPLQPRFGSLLFLVPPPPQS